VPSFQLLYFESGTVFKTFAKHIYCDMHACLQPLLSNGPSQEVNSGDACSTTIAKQGTDKHATNNSQYNNGSVFFGVWPRGYITRIFSEPGQFLVFDSGAAAVGDD
jgi:hypothetical protein